MATTKVTVMNRALAAVGQAAKAKIALPDEDTSDARTVRRFWDETLDSFLEEAWWSWATKYSTLSQDDSTAPEDWGYAYKLPADCVAPRRLVGNVPEEVPPFEEGVSANGIKVLWTDKQAAELEYTARIEDFNYWSGAAIRAFSLALAVDIAPAFKGSRKQTQELMALYQDALERARVASHNRQERRPVESSEFTDFRHGIVTSTRASARYVR